MISKVISNLCLQLGSQDDGDKKKSGMQNFIYLKKELLRRRNFVVDDMQWNFRNPREETFSV